MVGITLSNFTPNNPPVVPTPDRVYNSAIATKSKLIFCVPAFLEVCPHLFPANLHRHCNRRSGLRILRRWMLYRSLMLWYEDNRRYRWQKFNFFKLFGGAPIQKVVGDALAKNGVHLYPFYGAYVACFIFFGHFLAHYLPERRPEAHLNSFLVSTLAFPSCWSHWQRRDRMSSQGGMGIFSGISGTS